MRQQYRHRKSKIIVDKSRNGEFYCTFEGRTVVIPAAIVENSAEWQNVEPLFLTDDGVRILEGDYWWYVTIEERPKMNYTNVVQYGGLPQHQKPVKRFADKKNAQSFYNELTKKVSIAQLEILAPELKISKTTLALIKKHFNK
jgi:hypothetical protein